MVAMNLEAVTASGRTSFDFAGTYLKILPKPRSSLELVKYILGSNREVNSGFKPSTKIFRITVAKLFLFICLEKKRMKGRETRKASYHISLC